jgi:hypothetical protein
MQHVFKVRRNTRCILQSTPRHAGGLSSSGFPAKILNAMLILPCVLHVKSKKDILMYTCLG